MISVGEKFPSVIIKQLTTHGMQDFATDQLFQNKKVVLFAVPGAFTPTCSAKHLPGYVEQLQKFKSLGVEIACLSVNDPFVMKAWLDINKATGIIALADGNSSLTKALGLEMDGSAYGLGQRCQRAALFVDHGIVKAIAVEKPGTFEVSSAIAMLKVVEETRKAA